MNTPKEPTDVAAITPELALQLFRHLEYYREYMPVLVGKTEEKYAATKEAKGVDETLAAYRAATGVQPTYGPGGIAG